MMGALRSWLLTLIAVSLACGAADALMPRGAVKRVGRLVCGLAMALSILSPLVRVDIAAGERWLEDWLAGTRQREEALSQQAGEQLKSIIEAECAAYIVDKAAQLGVHCRARVTCRETEEGIFLPERTEVTGDLGVTEQRKLIQSIQEDLGVPEEQQIYINEEETA